MYRPEPPKITTSLADRIARLNATQASSPDRNQAAIQQPVGEIKSKISKYEATGQHEAPLVPKGSFGLGAPLTKPDRGLDRMRIASLGVSGGTTVSLISPSSLSGTSTSRSVSLSRPHSRRCSNLSSSEHHSSPTLSPSQEVPPPLPQTSIPTPPLNDPDPLLAAHHQHPTTAPDNLSSSSIDPEPEEEGNQSFDSAEAYDGILEGYPTTPAEEDCQPMVTCSDCLRPVELELLADHVCDLSISSSSSKLNSDQGLDHLPVDVPVDAVESPSLIISQDPSSQSQHDQAPPSPTSSSCCSSSKMPRQDASNAHLFPVAQPPSVPSPALPATTTTITSEELKPSLKDPSRRYSTQIRPVKVDSHPKNRNSDSSHSTNTTRLSAGNIPPSSSSNPPSARKSWYDDDDPDYMDSREAPTGFVTIVRASQRM
ncbi:hypothetical protein PCANC_27164 [Puccinia coronata f. sp. avenae]|uniref:Uncharacterized protein n=1 Tax=Puccinia coronata f. sp. avenae TaxID=200324 RepID=A0A2N5TJ16_9BASI|nr:hypothetical protein PCANC_27164 [Puccinia coronata f. sp. avenae]